MNITDVRVRKIAKEGKMRAVVSITIDDEFVVHDIKVIEGEKGLFIAMPSRKSSDGEYRDIAHPINTQTRDKLQKLVLEAYDKAEDVEELQFNTFKRSDFDRCVSAFSESDLFYAIYPFASLNLIGEIPFVFLKTSPK